MIKALDLLEKLELLPLQAMEALAKLVEWVAKNGKFVLAALRLETDPDATIGALKNSLGGMIAGVPEQAHAKLQQFAASLGAGGPVMAPAAPMPATAGTARSAPPGTTVVQRAPAPATQHHVPASQHLAGILRHLDKGLTYLKDHWWEELKKVGWNLLWPWPAVWGDLKDIWKEVKAGFEDAYHLHPGKVIDHVLAIAQKFNSILGNLYGWFFIASVLIGAIIGAFFGGAGAIPGALAGAAFAGEVGEALVVGLIATETAVIVKGIADLVIGNETAAEDEADYDKIAASTMTIAITGAMMLLGEIAAKLAKSIWDGVAGVFKGEKAPEIGEPAKTPEAPESDLTPEQPTPDGHEVEVTNDDQIRVCSDACDLIRERFKDLVGDTDKAYDNLRAKLDAADKVADPSEKLKAAAEVEEDLANLQKIRDWEATGKIKGDLTRLKSDLASAKSDARLGAQAELSEFDVQIKDGKAPEARGTQKGPDQPDYKVKARTDPFRNKKNAQNWFNDRIKAANNQFKGADSTGRIVINLGDDTTILETTLNKVVAHEIHRDLARKMVEEALSTKGRATNVTDVVVKDKAGNIIYEGLDK